MAQESANKSEAVSQFPLPPTGLFAPENGDAVEPVPPAPPGPDDSYAMFGRVYAVSDRLPSLQEAGRVCLYDPSAPPPAELRRLSKILIALFSALVSNLSGHATDPARLVARIEDVFVNMQHLLNTLRPGQACHDIRELLERQREQRSAASQALEDAHAVAMRSIQNASESLSSVCPMTRSAAEERAVAEIAAQREGQQGSQAPARSTPRGDAPTPSLDAERTQSAASAGKNRKPGQILSTELPTYVADWSDETLEAMRRVMAPDGV